MNARRTLGMATLLCSSMIAAQASAVTISASQIMSGYSGGLSFNAFNGASPGTMGLKSVSGVTGVGVTGGPSGNEIDIGQSIVASASGGFKLSSTELAFLFDGPEYGDVQEVAQLTATFLDGSSPSVVKVVNTYTSPTDTTLELYVDSVLHPEFILGESLATIGTPGTVDIGAVFGNRDITSLTFTALQGQCSQASGSTCTNQSDYSIASISTVPEPGSLALMGLGLVAAAFTLRRRSVV